MARERQPGAPVLRVGGDQLLAERGKPIRRAELRIRAFEPRERQVGALRRRVDHALPGRDRLGRSALLEADVAETQVRRRVARVELDGGLEAPGRLRDSPAA